MFLVELGPEEGEKGIAAVQPSGRSGGEVGEQGDALRLGQHRLELVPVGPEEVQHSENPKLDHGDPLQLSGHRACRTLRGPRHRPVTAGVTRRSHGAATVPRRPEHTASKIAPQRCPLPPRRGDRSTDRRWIMLCVARCALAGASIAFALVGCQDVTGPYGRADRLGTGPMMSRAAESTAPLIEHIIAPQATDAAIDRSEEHTSELQSRLHLVCRLLLEKKKKTKSRENSNTQPRHVTIITHSH